MRSASSCAPGASSTAFRTSRPTSVSWTPSRRSWPASPVGDSHRRYSGVAVRAEPIDRLRDDVRLLGELVGGVLREQGGADLLRAVEHARTSAIALRSNEGSEPALLAWAEQQSTARLLQLVRAFSAYFHLINLAEQHHRVRTLRERQRSQRGPLHESVAAAFEELNRQGVGRSELITTLERVEVHPVLTAQPS